MRRGGWPGLCFIAGVAAGIEDGAASSSAGRVAVAGRGAGRRQRDGRCGALKETLKGEAGVRTCCCSYCHPVTAIKSPLALTGHCCTLAPHTHAAMETKGVFSLRKFLGFVILVFLFLFSN